MTILRLLFVALCVLLVGCEEWEEEIAVEVEETVAPEEVVLVNVEPEIVAANEEIKLLDNGCYSNEVFIAEEETCTLLIDCIDIDSCIEWGNEVLVELEREYGSLVIEESVATGEEGITVLNTYDVDLDEEVIYTNDDISEEEMEYHADLWFSFSWLIPEENRKEINRFEVFESGDTLAYVSLHDAHDESWTLAMNNKNIELASETLVTYLHEYAHFLSLNQSQLDYWADEEGCEGIYLQDSGCFYKDAYITDFYIQFWHTPGNGELDEYFVSDYAKVSPEEDFSESFAHFVLTQTPTSDTVVEEKLQFFYQYDELVQLRTDIIARMATWLVRSVEL
ncbi:hypothetical protein [Lysinibacillus antri]|uniref:Uncharacterized protein n=1 Tax=Lysinibacillus antri TaxID=2498145 RepID=A0A432L935_9BACI|nr:hypothetical protein [Lysinibacillus antri]RUL49608.1 hypothetical protein EK386_15065 [Lysinibacillus antri]